jgi:mono/diheme cytochrome c family protein
MHALMKVAVSMALLACLAVPVLAADPKRNGPVAAGRDTLEIPDSAKDMRNPVRPDDEALRAGRALWRANCEICHGSSGRGDGPNARLHERRKAVRPQNLTNPAVQEGLTDGELFWRITHGIVDGDNVIMPAYRDKVPGENQRWQLVLFVRQLGATAARK